jgi:hypothetical protein
MAAALVSLFMLGTAAIYYGYQASANRKSPMAPGIGPSEPTMAAAGEIGPSGGDGDNRPLTREEHRPQPVLPGPEAATGDDDFAPAGVGTAAVDSEAEAGTGTGTGSLLVLSSPPFAEVYLDGRSRGVTPATITGLTAGTHRLLVQGRSGNPVDTLLRVGQGKRTVRVRLEAGAVAMEDVAEQRR